jgi:hypothetical protein
VLVPSSATGTGLPIAMAVLWLPYLIRGPVITRRE